ncbi:MAG TPA: metalloregulator ArsR/SmtB family transcription factor [Methyloradius sp.]
MEKLIAVAALDALAQETRLDIFRLLVQAGAAGMAAGAIGEKLGVPNATLSFHLQQLRHADLATTERKGTTILYKAHYSMMNGLIAYLTEHCCQGTGDDGTVCTTSDMCCPSAANQTKESA